ncbi:uncharacterized protein J8A68_006056 [[Candida] subhashii]|uniref:Helicase ATP-binding domain-containing protein n=1 Tax=[Candida] subhashii TaxID=561895 RepID=A0A8J5QKZ7_9ASCO|nr:uncharacterized protein J8A68_006056 [[Candida] subhashii]KAG7660430.1 hypothetical protein J8A68_006056 [[Candida] subhashii]
MNHQQEIIDEITSNHYIDETNFNEINFDEPFSDEELDNNVDEAPINVGDSHTSRYYESNQPSNENPYDLSSNSAETNSRNDNDILSSNWRKSLTKSRESSIIPTQDILSTHSIPPVSDSMADYTSDTTSDEIHDDFESHSTEQSNSDKRPFPRVSFIGRDKKVYHIEINHRGYKKYTFVHGLLIDKNGKLINTFATRFRERNRSLVSTIEQRGDTLADFNSMYNKETRLHLFNYEHLWDFVSPESIMVEYVGADRQMILHKKKSTNKDITTIKGVSVAISGGKSFAIHIAPASKENHIDLCYHVPEMRTHKKTHPLDAVFDYLTFTEDDLITLRNCTRSEDLDDGRDLFIKIYYSVVCNPKTRLRKAPRFHHKSRVSQMFPILQETTLRTYSSYFAHFYCLIRARGLFPHFEDNCSPAIKRVRDKFIESINAEERVTNLLEVFSSFKSMDGQKYLKSLLYVFSRKFDDGALGNVDTILIKLSSIKDMYKYCVFLSSSDQEIYKYANRNYRDDDHGLSLLEDLVDLLIRRNNELVKVEPGNAPGECYVNGISVKKSYCTDLYYKSAENFKERFRQLCNVTKSQTSIGLIYDQFLQKAKTDYSCTCLGEEMNNGQFNLNEAHKSEILMLILEMQKALASMMYVAAANTSSPAELLSLNIQGDNYEDRDIVFRDGLLMIQQNGNKNGSVERTLRHTTKMLSQFIVVLAVPVRSLFLRLLPELPELTHMFFDSSRYPDKEIVKRVAYRKFLFITHYGKLLTWDEVDTFQARVLNIDLSKVLGVRISRQAFTRFIRFDMPRSQGYIQSMTKYLDEKRQVHSNQTASLNYAIDHSNIEGKHALQDVGMMKGYFDSFFQFIGIEHSDKDGSLKDSKKVIPMPTGMSTLRFLKYEDLEDAKMTISQNFEFRDFDQFNAVIDIAFTPTVSRFILAPPGCGKTLIYYIPLIAFSKKADKNPRNTIRPLSVVLVSDSCVLDMIGRLEKHLTVLNAKDYANFSNNTDVLVAVYNDFENPGLVTFLSNFNSSYRKGNKLGLLVVDDVYTLREEYDFRKFKNFRDGIFSLFWKQIYLTPTIKPDFDQELISLLKVPVPNRLN